MPAPTTAFPIRPTGSIRIVSSAVSARRTARIRIQKTTTPATQANALSTWSASIQSSKLTSGEATRSGGRAERDHARRREGCGDHAPVRVVERRFEEREVAVATLDPPDRPDRSGPGGSK